MEISNISRYYVYVLGNTSRAVFYISTATNLSDKMQHLVISKREAHTCNELLYFEIFNEALTAIKREDQLKRFSNFKLLRLIKDKNPALTQILSYQ